MNKYILKRILISLATLFAIVVILFLMLEFMPGSPFNDEKLTAAQKAIVMAKYGLDQPIFIRFFKYLANMLHFDLGVSYVINKNFPVLEMIWPRLLISVDIGIKAMLVGSVIGLILGVIAALNHNKLLDNLTSGIAVFGVSIPSYVFALLLVYVFCYKFRIFPIFYDANQPFLSSILPIIALSVFPIANIARFGRSEMLEVLDSDYILLAKAKGTKQHKLIFRHVLRNGLIPVITIMGPLLVSLMTGSMVVERIFAIPGLGSLMVDAITNNDYNVVIACAFIYSALYIFIMLVVDILYGIVDPRIRIAKKES